MADIEQKVVPEINDNSIKTNTDTIANVIDNSTKPVIDTLNNTKNTVNETLNSTYNNVTTFLNDPKCFLWFNYSNYSSNNMCSSYVLFYC